MVIVSKDLRTDAQQREIAVVRSLAAVLENALADGDLAVAAGLAEQIADQLRRMNRQRAA